MKKALIALTAIALTVMGLGGGGIAASAQSNHTQSSHTLTVWLMTGEISTPVSNAVTTAFQKEYPGWTVNIEIQQWNGIATKLITALASTTPPGRHGDRQHRCGRVRRLWRPGEPEFGQVLAAQ